jgi:uncharacterized Zn ribbon protein
MKTKIILVTILLSLLSFGVFAQQQDMQKQMPKVETIEGKILKIYEFPVEQGNSFKIAIVVKSGNDEITSNAGVRMVLDSIGITLKENDTVKITGVRKTVNGKIYFKANELVKGDKTVTLKQMKPKGMPMDMQRGPKGDGKMDGKNGPEGMPPRPINDGAK